MVQRKNLTPFGWICVIVIQTYLIMGGFCWLVFVHDALHAAGQTRDLATILIDIGLGPILKGLLWPAFL